MCMWLVSVSSYHLDFPVISESQCWFPHFNIWRYELSGEVVHVFWIPDAFLFMVVFKLSDIIYENILVFNLHTEKWQSLCLFVLRFYGPVNPMGSCRARSVYLTTHLLGRLSPVTSSVHILSPDTDNCPSWISGRERMTVENILWSISTKECCRPRRGLNPRPPGLQSDGASNWATEAGYDGA